MTALWFVFLCGLALGLAAGILLTVWLRNERRVHGDMVDFTTKRVGS